jgi:hypothetical protein
LEQEFLRDIINRLEKTGIVYAITGSVASNFWGILRTTHDVDIVVVLSLPDASAIYASFSDSYYVSMPAIQDAIQRQSMFNVIDYTKSLKADMWVTRDDPFNQSMLARRRRLEILPGQIANVGSPEDILLHKLVWNRIMPSERQLADAAGIAAVQAGKLDLEYIKARGAMQSTLQVLDEVLEGKFLKST